MMSYLQISNKFYPSHIFEHWKTNSQVQVCASVSYSSICRKKQPGFLERCSLNQLTSIWRCVLPSSGTFLLQFSPNRCCICYHGYCNKVRLRELIIYLAEDILNMVKTYEDLSVLWKLVMDLFHCFLTFFQHLLEFKACLSVQNILLFSHILRWHVSDITSIFTYFWSEIIL